MRAGAPRPKAEYPAPLDRQAFEILVVGAVSSCADATTEAQVFAPKKAEH
jgi:hypothetical protein